MARGGPCRGGTASHKTATRIIKIDTSKRATKRMLSKLNKRKTQTTNKGGFA